MKIGLLQKNQRGTYRHNFSYQKKWKDAENDNSESQYKNSELNSAWEK